MARVTAPRTGGVGSVRDARRQRQRINASARSNDPLEAVDGSSNPTFSLTSARPLALATLLFGAVDCSRHCAFSHRVMLARSNHPSTHRWLTSLHLVGEAVWLI